MPVNNKYTIQRRYIRRGNARSGQKLVTSIPQFIVAHETANNNADADDHFNYFNNQQPSASAHTFIDDSKILEIIPLDEKAWHVQYQVTRDNEMFGEDANDAAIGVELCRPGSFSQAYDRYVWYFAYLCRNYNLRPSDHIVAHSYLDPSRRSDPQSWLQPNGVSWSEFLNDVQYYYDRWDVMGSVYKDVPDNHWAIDSIEQMKELGIMSGYPDGTFGLGEAVTREEIAVIADRLYRQLSS
ncbi:hypothetical protein TMU01_30680 [Tenuibacillus multivorans]|uniref:N-acetylmuramoyl-L-alanine amidase n=2 Tax=Tenuibacillus multivorans TaxID=237069 RepID=A0A1G9ZN90_9BACI|nr:hypothetical protein TMU01_30680 [Tenuibacillus multivorans]SDN22829.1 N-acetylmuramoyl-L-alanine amidase [Tenuibacillus multivorans]